MSVFLEKQRRRWCWALEVVSVGGEQTVPIVQTVQTALIGNLWLIKHRDLFLLSRWLDGGHLLLFNALLLSLTLL